MLKRRKRKSQAPDTGVVAEPDFESGAVRIIRPTESETAGHPVPGDAAPHLVGNVAARADATDDMTRTGRVEVQRSGGMPDWGDEPGWLSNDESSDRLDATVRESVPSEMGGADAAAEVAGLDPTRPSTSRGSASDNDATAPDHDRDGGGGTDPLLREGRPVTGGRTGGSSSVRLLIGDDHDSVGDVVYDGSDTLGVVFDPRADAATQSTSDESSGEPQRRTVVIADDGAAALTAEPASSARRGMDPRFRERRKAVRRALGRKRMVGLGVGLISVLLVVVVSALLASGLFAVRASKVEVIGWQHADRAQVESVLDGLIGTPVLRVDEEQVATELEAIAWVETAKVTTGLPNSATIEIAERSPLATFQGPDDRYRVIDRYGRVLDILDGFPVEFVWITSATPPNLEVGEFAPAGFTAAAELTRNLTPEIRPRVQRIAVEPSGQALVLYMRDGAKVNFGAASDLFSKLVRLQTLVTTYPDMTDAEIDVSTEETTRASDDLLKIKEAERQREAEQAAAAEAAAADAAAAEAADNGAPTADDGN